MRHHQFLAATAAALLLAGCDSAAEAPKADAAAEAPKTLAPGEYSYTSEVTKLASTARPVAATVPSMKLRSTPVPSRLARAIAPVHCWAPPGQEYEDQ